MGATQDVYEVIVAIALLITSAAREPPRVHLLSMPSHPGRNLRATRANAASRLLMQLAGEAALRGLHPVGHVEAAANVDGASGRIEAEVLARGPDPVTQPREFALEVGQPPADAPAAGLWVLAPKVSSPRCSW